MCSLIKSSFHGKISEIAGISVDNFEEHNLKSRAFFLSHCHSDHIQGLFSRSLLRTLKANNAFIYMSKLSAAIVADSSNSDPVLMSHIKTLHLGTNHLTLPRMFGCDEMFIRLTIIPAGHCLGSVMFLFETSNLTVLYTGDFNLSITDVCNIGYFHDKDRQPIKIDVVYIDTTFISKDYEYFPKRSLVVSQLIDYIKEWLGCNNKNRIALSTSAKYGYEYVFNEIYRETGMKVLVKGDKWKFYSLHDELAEGVTNVESETPIHVCLHKRETYSHKNCLTSEIDHSYFLFIRLSAQVWGNYELEESGIRKVSNNRINVCFATHCCRTDIISFLNYFAPKKVVGFPNEFITTPTKESMDRSHVIKCHTPRKHKIVSPQKNIFDEKVDKKKLKAMFEMF